MKRVLAPLACCVFLGAAAPDEGGSLAERYERARALLEQERANAEEAQGTRDRLAGETQSLQERLIANAARVQELEASLAATTEEIAILALREAELSGPFARNREAVGRLLAVIQRLDADAPPALVVRPDDSLAAARGAMMLGAVLPPVYEQAAVVGRQLRELSATRAALEAKHNEARAETMALNAARGDLASLLEQRRAETSAAEARLQDVLRLTEEAARETSDLRSLLDRVATLRAQADTGGIVVVTPQSGGGGALQRGSLFPPVVGAGVPGDPAGPGMTPGTSGPQGLWYEAGGGAQAVAPGDGEVIFAGPYQKFGQVLILEMAGGYHLLMAGFSRIDVRIGDLVLAGEPVGILPEGTASQLYVELRRDNRTIDPAPWMSAELRKASAE
jgi:septal ring factor EnvC (AmiA/AmiB activator)